MSAADTNRKLDLIINQQNELIKANQQNREQVAEVLKWINGNGHPGAKVRIDRLEQNDAREAKWRWAMISAMIGLAFTKIGDVLSWFGR